jgi:hypothetical protein
MIMSANLRICDIAELIGACPPLELHDRFYI